MCILLSMIYGLCKPCWLTHVTWICFKGTTFLLNVHLSCFANFIPCPTDKYMFKVNNKQIRLICCICSKIKINTAWYSSGTFIVDVDRIQHINIVFLLLALNNCLVVGCERQVIMFWKHKKLYICFIMKRPISFSDLSLHWIEINYKHVTTLWTYSEHMFQL